MNKPSMQFYPGDWKKDPAVRCLSLAARGLWFEMLLLMHESSKPGFLCQPNGEPVALEKICRMVGGQLEEVKHLLAELEEAGTFSKVDEGDTFAVRFGVMEGVIFSRRLVRDADISQKRAEAGIKGKLHGSKGGRPKKTAKTPNETANITPNLTANLTANSEKTKRQNNPPSSSSSTSTSLPPKSPEGDQEEFSEEPDDGAFRPAWDAFSKWSTVATRFPLRVAGNEERHLRKLLAGIADQPPIIHGGLPTPQRLLVPLAVESFIAENGKWESLAYACKCVQGRLDKWAKQGVQTTAPARSGAGTPIPTGPTLDQQTAALKKQREHDAKLQARIAAAKLADPNWKFGDPLPAEVIS